MKLLKQYFISSMKWVNIEEIEISDSKGNKTIKYKVDYRIGTKKNTIVKGDLKLALDLYNTQVKLIEKIVRN